MKTNKEFFAGLKLKSKALTTGWHRLSVAVALSACLVNFTACDKYDLDETDPEGWGASIYSYLEEDGNFTNTVKLIDDLGLKNVLAKTGSKTMFVADDDAFARFYAQNKWGVKRYEQLSLSQKKILLLGGMINNAYQIMALSSIEGPVEGQCMRRASSQSIYDSVTVVTDWSQLPNMQPGDEKNNVAWQKFRGRDKVVIMNDGTAAPMIHFIEQQMVNKKITNEDYNFLYNHTTDRKPGDASVNGVKISKQNIKCSNGFIHQVDEVVLPLDNMAEIIASKPQASVFNKMLQRFSAPYYMKDDVTRQYNYLYNANVDSVFQKRFFSKKSQNGEKNDKDDDNNVMKSLLKYDPAWNSYYSGYAITSAAVELEKDMGVFMVPSDSALDRYWNHEAGTVLRDQFESWDNVPNDVIVELLNNNMLESFVSSVPSKFDEILNDANDPMGVKVEDIDSVWLGCNGAVYLTNKVYSPTSFVSVLYPAIVNETMKIVKWGVEQNQYNYYLNSLNSRYSFFIPTNDALLEYIDPVTYYKEKPHLYRFHYDKNRTNPVWAAVYEYDEELGMPGDSLREETDVNALKGMLKDILDNHIVIGDVEDGNEFYKTKSGASIRVKNVALQENGMTVEGSKQINETGQPLYVSKVYNQTKDGNGKCYILDKQPIQTTRQTVIEVLRKHSEMSEFCKILEGSSMLERVHDEKHACVGENLSVFNTYNYTVYVPSNEAVLKLIADGKLPTWDEVDAVDEDVNIPDTEKPAKKKELSAKIENFLRLHIQDGALFIGSEPLKEDGYETACVNEKTGKFERVYATLTKDDLTVRMTNGKGDNNYSQVVKTPGLYNIMTREYQLVDKDKKDDIIPRFYTASTAVVHLIDKAFTR